MLVRIYPGICAARGLDAATAGLAAPFAVAMANSVAMLFAGGTVACAVHRWNGMRALRSGWLNLEGLWAASPVLIGALLFQAAIST